MPAMSLLFLMFMLCALIGPWHYWAWLGLCAYHDGGSSAIKVQNSVWFSPYSFTIASNFCVACWPIA